VKIFIVGRFRQPLSATSQAEGLTRNVGPARTPASSHGYQRKDKPRSLSGGARLALWAGAEGRIWGVDNVHTLGLGLGRMWVGSDRIPHVSVGAQGLQGGMQFESHLGHSVSAGQRRFWVL
jgi:hypothetical protein